MTTSIGRKGAISALKGYRTQALYSIARILNSPNTDITYTPEGNEDLDIHSKASGLIEVVQVKNLNEPLSFSDLYSRTGTSFLTRCIDQKRQGKHPKLTVVSFGKLGPEITTIFSNRDGLRKKLLHSGFTEGELDYLAKEISIQEVDEEVCYNDCEKGIRNFEMAIDPVLAIDYLHYWIFYLSEKGVSTTHRGLRKKLDDIGKFVNERKQLHNHLQNSIRPFYEREFDDRAKHHLSEGFYQGIGAHYDHIGLDLDVIRTEKLERINDLFHSNNIVVVHGASGQGKSTLAFRYIKDYSQLLAYGIVHLSEYVSTLEQIQALHGISKSLEIPVLLHLDVKPGNEHWALILEEFAYHSYFRFLVTIREEDWNQTSAKGVTFQYGDLELDFNKNEACWIYEQLNNIHSDQTFTSFEEAWTNFGGKGPLLEFVYLISQGEPLKDRLKAQLNNIEQASPDFLALLKIVCLADSWMARADIEKLPQAIVENKLRLIVKSLENEFLIRFSHDERALIGLHPIRSKIITELAYLTEKEFLKTALDTLSYIYEEDIEAFMVQLFQRFPNRSNTVINALIELKLDHFTGYKNVFQALIWFGMNTFIQTHQDLLNKIYEADNFLLSLMTYFNFTGTLEKSNLFPENAQFQTTQDDLKTKLDQAGISKDDILATARTWLNQHPISATKINSSPDFSAFGQILFWIDYLDLKKTVAVSNDQVRDALLNSSVTASAKAMFGMHASNDWKNLAAALEESFLEKVAARHQVGYFERTDNSIKAHFLFDLSKDFDSEIDNIIHTRKIQVIESLRYGLPYYKSHGAQGYGHKLSLIPVDHDDSKAQIPVENNPIEYLVQLNSRLRNLFMYKKRMPGWREFTQKTVAIRQKELDYLSTFLNPLKKALKTGKSEKLLDFVVNIESFIPETQEYKVLLPQKASDASGRISENTSLQAQHLAAHYSLLHKLFTEYLDFRDSVYRALENFNWQAIKVLYDHMNIASDEKKPHLKRVSLINLFDAFKGLGRYQKSFRQHFSKYLDAQKIEELERQEVKVLSELTFTWTKFVNPKSTGRKSASLNSEFQRIKERFKRELENYIVVFGGKHHFKLMDLHFDLIPHTVIIELDFSSPLNIPGSLELIHKAISKATKRPSGIDLMAPWMEIHCDEIWMIPSIDDMALNNKVYKFRSYNYLHEGPKELSSRSFIPQEVSDTVFSDLKYIFFKDPDKIIFKAEEILKQWQELLLNVSLVLDIFKLLEHSKDSKVLEQRLKSSTQNAEESLGCINDYLGNLRKELPYTANMTEKLLELHELIDLIHTNTSPPDYQGIDGNVSLGIHEIELWKDNLESLAPEMGYFYLVEIERAIKKATN